MKILLNEAISLEQALASLQSKATKRHIYAQIFEREQMDLEVENHSKYMSLEPVEKLQFVKKYVDKQFPNIYNLFIKTIPRLIPSDLTEEQKALSIVWLKNTTPIYRFFGIYDEGNAKRAHDFITVFLERYFQWHRFVDKKDLNSIKDFDELQDIVRVAGGKHKEWSEEQSYRDADAGTEVIYEDDKWKIFIPNNRGAACQLGKGTDWCTAAPGTQEDYYAHYHKPEDPLFIIYRKPYSDGTRAVVKDNPDMNGAIAKYQFHYGSGQFRNEADEQIWETFPDDGMEKVVKPIHRILVATVGERFPILHNFIETDIGLSQKIIQMNQKDSSIEKIKYKDIITGEPYGGLYPDIEITSDIDELDENAYFENYDFRWNQIAGEHLDRGIVGASFEGNPNGPSYLKIHEYYNAEGRVTKIKLQNIHWYIMGHSDAIRVASWVSGDVSQTGKPKFNIRPESDDLWENHFKQQYENLIKGRESEFAKDILDAFVPGHKEKTIYAEPQTLKENLLKELTVQQANDSLYSKATKKRIEQLLGELGGGNYEPRFNIFINKMQGTIPKDISDKQKALSIIWVKNFVLQNVNIFAKFMTSGFGYGTKLIIEKYWQMHNFIEPEEYKDINKIQNLDQFAALAGDARPRYEAYLEKKLSKDASAGTEYLGGNEYVKVYVAHNKGAACQLGKQTSWCTAAPGLNFFEKYYKPNDPLFVFIQQNGPTDPTEQRIHLSSPKYQFHYGSEQFMNADDNPVIIRELNFLHNILLNLPGVKEKYPIVATKNVEYPVSHLMRDIGL